MKDFVADSEMFAAEDQSLALVFNGDLLGVNPHRHIQVTNAVSMATKACSALPRRSPPLLGAPRCEMPSPPSCWVAPGSPQLMCAFLAQLLKYNCQGSIQGSTSLQRSAKL
jgi:hypothetical protein